MELFCENSLRLLAVKLFSQKSSIIDLIDLRLINIPLSNVTLKGLRGRWFLRNLGIHTFFIGISKFSLTLNIYS